MSKDGESQDQMSSVISDRNFVRLYNTVLVQSKVSEEIQQCGLGRGRYMKTGTFRPGGKRLGLETFGRSKTETLMLCLLI